MSVGQYPVTLPDAVITVATDANDSPWIGPVDGLSSLVILAPGTLTGAINVQVHYADERPAVGSAGFDLKSAGSNISVAASAAVIVTNLGGARWIRVHSDNTEASDRTFVLRGQE